MVAVPNYGLLQESKHIGSRQSTSRSRDFVLNLTHSAFPKFLSLQKRSHDSASRRTLFRLQQKYQGDLLRIIGQLETRSIPKSRAKTQTSLLIRNAFKNAYRLGMMSGGLHNVDLYTQFMPRSQGQLDAHDLRWLASAAKQEVEYANKFLYDVTQGYERMPWPRRAEMYADTLYSIWHAGRLQAHPTKSLIYWVSFRDERTCPECDLLDTLSPYIKTTLPTTPGAGSCRCLSNCRCKLIYRTNLAPGEYAAALEKQRDPKTVLRILGQSRRTRKGIQV